MATRGKYSLCRCHCLRYHTRTAAAAVRSGSCCGAAPTAKLCSYTGLLLNVHIIWCLQAHGSNTAAVTAAAAAGDEGQLPPVSVAL
jgi:hypothetical protein